MGNCPDGVNAKQWREARLKACHKHLRKHRTRAMVRKAPEKIRYAFLQGWCDGSDKVIKFLHGHARYCGHCGGVGTLIDKPKTPCVHCTPGRKKLDAIPGLQEQA